jgi:uncharacterized protein with von Willebrand factor type A (vWA) domain
MKARIAALVAALRRAELPVSVAEAMDAAAAAARAGVERPVLRDALAAALVKDERDRPVFLDAFEAVFPARAEVALATKKSRRRQGGEPGGGERVGDAAGGGASAGAAAGAATEGHAAAVEPRRAARPARGAASDTRADARHAQAEAPRRASDGRDERDAERSPRGEPAPRDAPDDAASAAEREKGLRQARRQHALARVPFRAMSPADVEEAGALARAIARRVTARFRRRLAPRVVGRLDFRRTIRAAVPRGGVPFERRFRGRRPGRPDLVALVDLSASAATASGFFLSLLAPAAPFFRHVHLFGYVDRPVEIEFVAGQVRPAGAIDLMARSDFGRVLRDLTEQHAGVLGADTVLVILGDARNNRLPPRADLLGRAHGRVRRLLWLNPEPRERWNTGDSVIAAYARHADDVVPCGSLAELERALAAVARW